MHLADILSKATFGLFPGYLTHYFDVLLARKLDMD